MVCWAEVSVGGKNKNKESLFVLMLCCVLESLRMFCVCFCFCVFSERHGCVCVGVVVEEGRGEIEEKRRMKGGLGDELYMRVVKYMCVCVLGLWSCWR